MPNKLDKLLINPAHFLRWLDDPEAKRFNEYLSDYRAETTDKLVREKDTVELYRLQGKLKALDDIIQLRGEISNYVKGVTNGTMKPINKENVKHVQ